MTALKKLVYFWVLQTHWTFEDLCNFFQCYIYCMISWHSKNNGLVFQNYNKFHWTSTQWQPSNNSFEICLPSRSVITREYSLNILEILERKVAKHIYKRNLKRVEYIFVPQISIKQHTNLETHVIIFHLNLILPILKVVCCFGFCWYGYPASFCGRWRLSKNRFFS